jgi:hypothetical protein
VTIEDARGATVLPLGRRGPGAEPLGGNLAYQLAHIEREAGRASAR